MGQTLDINSVRSNNLILKYLRSTLSVWKGLENLSLRQRQKQNSKMFLVVLNIFKTWATLGVKSSHSSFVSRVVWVETPCKNEDITKTNYKVNLIIFFKSLIQKIHFLKIIYV